MAGPPQHRGQTTETAAVGRPRRCAPTILNIGAALRGVPHMIPRTGNTEPSELPRQCRGAGVDRCGQFVVTARGPCGACSAPPLPVARHQRPAPRGARRKSVSRSPGWCQPRAKRTCRRSSRGRQEIPSHSEQVRAGSAALSGAISRAQGGCGVRPKAVVLAPSILFPNARAPSSRIRGRAGKKAAFEFRPPSR